MSLVDINYPPIRGNIAADKLAKLDLYGDLLFHEAMPAGFIGDCTRTELDLRHLLDSVLPAIAPESSVDFALWNEVSLNVFDLGAGAGLPSVPLAILFPQHKFFLIDAQEKRLRFVEGAAAKLGLRNIETVHSVVQSFDKPEKADVVIFRAFRKILASLELSLHVLRSPAIAASSPKVLYWRSQSVPFSAEGFKRVADLGFTIDSFVKFASAENILPRGLYTFAFNGKTQKGFPRSWKKISADKLVETES